jgi:hypothetical protein
MKWEGCSTGRLSASLWLVVDVSVLAVGVRWQWSKLLACFSLSESYKALTEPPRPGQFLCLDAIRTISL